jgi:hypothetical protein
MRILKKHPILGLANSFLVDSPQPANLSYMWNFGSLLGLCLIVQILTGVFLRMHYTPSVDLAFVSVEHIMRDVNYGWLLRYLHANTASFFFIFVYLHIARGLYYGSYKSPRILPWSIGVIILVLMMAIAFLGYVLPYGQMSLWGATVITNLLSAIPWIGQDFVEFVAKSDNSNFISALIGITLRYYIYAVLAPIGNINYSKLRGNHRKPRSREEMNNILKNVSYDFLSMLVGLIDGDGYIAITNNKGYVRIELIISLDPNSKDEEMLQYIQKTMKIGRVNRYASSVKYTIPKVEIQEVFFPLLQYHSLYFLTNVRAFQYNKALYILNNNITSYSEVENKF